MPAVNISAYQPGYYNITAVYVGNENYTQISTTWFLTVNDTTSPNVTITQPFGIVIDESANNDLAF